MSIGYKYKDSLTKEQNKALSDFAVSIAAQFKYTNNVRFTTINNQLRFTNRLYAGTSNYPNLSTVSDDKSTQKLVSDLFINLKINNNKISANASMKLAYLATSWATSSTRYNKAHSSAMAVIDANANLSTTDKDNLKTSANVSLSAMYSAIFSKQSAETMRWAKTKLKLNADLTLNSLYENRARINVDIYTALTNTVREVENNDLNAITNVAANLSVSLGASNVSSDTNSIMSSVNASIGFMTTFSGTSDREVDQGFNKSMSSVGITAELMADMDATISNLVSNGTLTDDEASSFKIDIIAKFFASFQASSVHVHNDGDS